ncbi:MAG TPA: class I SAM-dependent methyltransferase [Candidatus Dormibacteraeota bacterium]|nr:class I SAM-dependent methyltransferase [Candidatus Dormibacteraeota bacterium]
MLTVDFDRLGVGPGTRLLDIGCGLGRHSFEAFRRGAQVTAADLDTTALAEVDKMSEAMVEAGQVPPGSALKTAEVNVLDMPFDDGSFDVVIASEILEHIPEDRRAMSEITRVLRPRGLAAVTVPRRGPEEVCWLLSDDYHNTPGGHVRIYRGDELVARLRGAGLRLWATTHAHGLHSPYWWLKCAVGVRKDDSPLPRLYHRFLVWDMVNAPPLTRAAEAALNPIIGKSFVAYLEKPAAASARSQSANGKRSRGAAV